MVGQQAKQAVAGGTKRADRLARRREILDVAFAEFAEKGYAATSMAAIARRARASKETLYAWFQNKQTLFNTVFASRLQGLASRVQSATREDRSPSNVLPIVAEDVLRFHFATAPLFRAAGSGGAGFPERGVGQAIVDDRQNFVDYLLWCRDQGYLAFDDDAFEVASLFVAMSVGEWDLRLGTGMIDELTDEMITAHAQRVTRLFLKALAPS